jgi:glycosyltransferase involved in cell wall biosynthesis
MSLAAAGIDVVIVPTLLPETFCFVAYEAIAAGCIVVTLAGSGQVAALAGGLPQVVVYPDEPALVAAFGSGSFRRRAHEIEVAGFSTPVLHHTGTTATLHRSST